ncbi:MAG: hypothetical protein ABS85_12280 [Sphingobacteriales bacterium SCN 48-20]|jgi:hypothetical protein|uniref:hypothetical protein n=1 Tax=Terrimonas ferruginea TaxID=249 RepID=UPI00086AA9F4|nr:hypothetical protein [Terrimonas ferruginea]MBN8782335.1 hypothetical protein [Terrimonas ferruginea]ODT91580.1 MAG: hypothetical protein ABS85_12280 [Sphingobacteriales bacterium SCN 48-20]OJW42857.1 MAG: hypothetical protein BGO56_12530 [Sphingobacteriales bacterium 48-107]
MCTTTEQTPLEQQTADQPKQDMPAKPVRPDHEILYNYLFQGKITMEEYVFLTKKKIEGSIGG